MPTFAAGLKRPVWIAAGSMVGGVRLYGTPVLHQWNCRGLNTGIAMMTFGPSFTDYRKIVTDNAEIVGIEQLDRAWVDTTPGDPTDVLASDAGFFVFSAVPGVSGVAEIFLKKLSTDA